MPEKIYPLVCDFGIQKDGTEASTKRWTDGLWMRFQRGVPNAIGGWRRVQPKYADINGTYPTDYTIGQNNSEINTFIWNAYSEYQPRNIHITANSNYNNYNLILGCSDNYQWLKITSNNDGTTSLSNWSMPLPQTDGEYSCAVTYNCIDNEGNVEVVSNDYSTNNILYFQNLTAIGPYVGYYTKTNTRWVFESAFCGIIPAMYIKKDTSDNYTTEKQSNGSNTLFGIALYDLDSINTTSIKDTFSVTINGTLFSKVCNVFPIVHVTSLDSKNLEYANNNNIILPMYQLSHSGNPLGAGRGGPQISYVDNSWFISDPSNYGENFDYSNNGHTGIGFQYFPAAINKQISAGPRYVTQTGYIWSSDCVYCSGGVLNMSPYVFFYNYHPWDWSIDKTTLNNPFVTNSWLGGAPSPTNGYIAFTYENMDIYTTAATPTKANTPVMVTTGSGIIPGADDINGKIGTTIIQDFVQVSSTKIVYGAQVRGGSNSPSALFWSLDSLIKCTFVGGTTVFSFDTVASNLSILSSKCVVEVNGLFYWIGLDQFYFYNGTIQTLYNDTNINYFFKNVDTDKSQRIWGCKVGQYNEIWWHYPNKNLDNYTGECNAVLIFNYTPGQECWYNSDFPVTSNLTQAGRVCGTSISQFKYPVWIDAYKQPDPTPYSTATGNYWFAWIHENSPDVTFPGHDSLISADTVSYKTQFLLTDTVYSIPTYLTSRVVSLPAISPDGNWGGVDRWLKMNKIEPDLIQYGDLDFSLVTKKYIKDYEESSSTYKILADDSVGVCFSQNVSYNYTGDAVSMTLNGNYVSEGVAVFPYPRKITIKNYTYFYITLTSKVFEVGLSVTITGTYKKQVVSETITVPANIILRGYTTGESTNIYDTITNISVIFTQDSSIAYPEGGCSGGISIGTKIPYGTESGNVESDRLRNFYIDIYKQMRILKIKFSQNLIGSDFQLGQFLMHFDVGDERQ